MQWCSWLRQCSASRHVVGSIPDGITGIFHWHNPSGHTQPLTDLNTMRIDGRCLQLTTLPFSCADCREIWEPQPPATLRACPGLYKDFLTFTFVVAVMVWCLNKHRFNFTFIRGIQLEFGFMIRNVCLNVTWIHLCVL